MAATRARSWARHFSHASPCPSPSQSSLNVGDFIMAVDGISGNSEKMWCALRDCAALTFGSIGRVHAESVLN
eukprot:2783380-Amphidinium_carterae.2